MFKRSLLHSSLFAFAIAYGTAAFGLDYGTVTSSLDRSNPNQLTLTINMTSVTPSDNAALGIVSSTPSEFQQAIANHLDICLPATPAQTACGETDVKVKYAIGRLPTEQTGIYVSTTQIASFPNNGTIATTDVQDPTIHSYKIDILINDAGAAIPNGQRVLIRLYPDKISSNGNKDKNDIVTKLGSGVADAVAVTGAYPTPISLIAAWTHKPSVTFVDGSTGSPNGVLGILLPNISDATTASFPAITYVADPNATAPVDTTCNVVPEGLDTDNPTCSVTCAQAGQVTARVGSFDQEGVKYAINNALAVDTSSLGFNDLTIANGPYAIVLQYLPEGVAFSCVIGSPSDAATLSQIIGGPTPKSGDPSCFIATAAYGSALDPHIDVLRWFRDAYLLETSWGKAFVHAYYKNSPPVAAWIKNHEWARTATRGALWAPVLALETFRDHRAFAIAFVIILTLGAVQLLRRRSLKA